MRRSRPQQAPSVRSPTNTRPSTALNELRLLFAGQAEFLQRLLPLSSTNGDASFWDQPAEELRQAEVRQRGRGAALASGELDPDHTSFCVLDAVPRGGEMARVDALETRWKRRLCSRGEGGYNKN